MLTASQLTCLHMSYQSMQPQLTSLVAHFLLDLPQCDPRLPDLLGLPQQRVASMAGLVRQAVVFSGHVWHIRGALNRLASLLLERQIPSLAVRRTGALWLANLDAGPVPLDEASRAAWRDTLAMYLATLERQISLEQDRQGLIREPAQEAGERYGVRPA